MPPSGQTPGNATRDPANSNLRPTTAAIVGAGFSGVATAINMLQNQISADDLGEARPRLDLTIFEQRRDQFGGGLAYSDNNGPEHFTNIPARILSIVDSDPDHFTNWLRNLKADNWQMQNGETVPDDLRGEFGPHNIVPRALYGRYLQDTLDTSIREAEARGVAKVEKSYERVFATQAYNHGVVVQGRGVVRQFDHAVLATGHIEFGTSPALTNVHQRIARRVVSSPRTSKARTEAILSGEAGSRVTIMGSGLSAYDHIQTALKNGFFDNPRAHITLISRHGNRHPVMPAEPFNIPDIKLQDLLPPPREARRVPDYVEDIYDRYRAQGHKDWEITAAVRPHIKELVEISQIPPRRLFGILRAHSSRVTTGVIGVGEETGDKVEQLIAQGKVRVIEGSLHRVRSSWRGRLRMEYTPTGRDDGAVHYTDALISALGPQNDYLTTRHPVYNDLERQGAFQIHQNSRVGITVDPDTRQVMRVNGFANDRLYAVGPMTAGQTAEQEGHLGPFGQNVPTLRRHAAQAANAITPRPVLVLGQDQQVGEPGFGARLTDWLRGRRGRQAPQPDKEPATAGGPQRGSPDALRRYGL